MQQAHHSNVPGYHSETNWEPRPRRLNTLRHARKGFRPSCSRRVALGPGPTQYLVWPFSLYCQGRNWALRLSSSRWKSAAAQLYQTPNFPEFPWLSDPTPSSEASAASPGSGAPVSEVAGAARAQEPPPGAERAQVAGVVPPSLPQPTLARPPRSSLRPSSPGSSIRPWCAACGDLLGLNGHPLPSTGLRRSSASGPG